MIPNETYLISYESGSCGNFLGCILQQILAQDHIAYQKILEFPESHAHHVDFWSEKHLDEKNFYTFIATKYFEKPFHTIENTISVDHNKPLVYRDHRCPDWELFFNKFVNGKNLVITFSESMLVYLLSFRWKKVFSNGANLTNNDIWFGHVDKFPFSYKYPLKISNIYTDKIIEIKMEDLLFNKEKILNTLTMLTNKPIPDFVDKSYDNYLLAQKQHYPKLFKN